MRICICIGTRPEIIKMSPIIRLCEARGLDYFVLHTGQHYSFNMDKLFFEELSLPEPAHNLEVGGETFGLQVGRMMRGMHEILERERPDAILVQGDTNSVLAGALSASKVGMRIGHVEAGLRSFDRTMPEEINRILTDHLSDLLFAPTETARRNLLDEGIEDSKIAVTGNTVVEALRGSLERARSRSTVLEANRLEGGEFLLVTLHRPECVDDQDRLSSVLEGLDRLAHLGLPIVFPVHPRTRERLRAFSLEERLAGMRHLRVLEPVGYLDFVRLEAEARLVLTDAGGVQEEACILKVPCVTLRENTERPETVQIGCNMLAGYHPDTILVASQHMLQRNRDWEQPYGEGDSASMVLDRVLEAQGVA